MKEGSKKLLYIVLAILAVCIVASILCYEHNREGITRVEDFPNHSEIKR